MKNQFVELLKMVAIACVVLPVIMYGAELYHSYNIHIHLVVFYGIGALLLLRKALRTVIGPSRPRQKDCWLQYIHETPRDDPEFDLIITYRYNDQEATFYGRKASRERAKVIALPPVESWEQKLPSWVNEKREFVLTTLSDYYEVQWTESTLYPVQGQIGTSDDVPSTQVPEQTNFPSTYGWKLQQEDSRDWKGRSLIYEEPGFRLVTYVEMSGVSEFDWLGGDTALLNWTEPEGIPIEDYKQQELLTRLAQWCRQHNTRLSFSPSGSWEEYLWREERAGNTVVHNDDGSVMIIPPSRDKS